jgi:hypothetical protein
MSAIEAEKNLWSGREGQRKLLCQVYGHPESLLFCN